MTSRALTLFLGVLVAIGALVAHQLAAADGLRLVTLDPGHFHAALFQKEMLPGVSEHVHIYAPVGADLVTHLSRIAQYNARRDQPTAWTVEIHAGPDYWEQFQADREVNVVVLSGRNGDKLARLSTSIRLGRHVLADKPWIITANDLPGLQAALEQAEEQGVVAYDAMTQRFEITCLLQRELVNDPAVFGGCLSGSRTEPAVSLESTHYLLKQVSGVPILRPAWFFDLHQQGEGLTDVGTHLVDLVPWTLFPEQPLDYRHDLKVLDASRWPTPLTRAQFRRVTGERDFPDYLRAASREDGLDYYANNRVHYTIRGVHVRLEVRWDFEALPGTGDTEMAVFRGRKAQIEVRQGKPENFLPELYVLPNGPDEKENVFRALTLKVERLQSLYPGLAVEVQSERFHLIIPAKYRLGHEDHFAQLTRRFLDYCRDPKSLPAWEKPNMLAKYYVTTRGVELARREARGPKL